MAQFDTMPFNPARMQELSQGQHTSFGIGAKMLMEANERFSEAKQCRVGNTETPIEPANLIILTVAVTVRRSNYPCVSDLLPLQVFFCEFIEPPPLSEGPDIGFSRASAQDE
jgi:hypothetical protein